VNSSVAIHVASRAGIITAQWKGETLHFNYLDNPGTERQSERTEDWTLSHDVKKLIDQEWVKRANGQDLRYKVVFDRQPSSSNVLERLTHGLTRPRRTKA